MSIINASSGHITDIVADCELLDRYAKNICQNFYLRPCNVLGFECLARLWNVVEER